MYKLLIQQEPTKPKEPELQPFGTKMYTDAPSLFNGKNLTNDSQIREIANTTFQRFGGAA